MSIDASGPKGSSPTEKFTLTATGSSTFGGGDILIHGNGENKTAKITFTGNQSSLNSSIHNTGGTKLTGTFNSGAKMTGNLNAYNGSSNTFTFNNGSTNTTVFEGSLYSRNSASTNALTFTAGNYETTTHGITAHNNGHNTLTFSGSSAQTLQVNSIGARSSEGDHASTENKITFTGDVNHKAIVLKDFNATGGRNIFTMDQGSLTIRGSLATAPSLGGTRGGVNTITIKKSGDSSNNGYGLIVVGKDVENPKSRAIYSYGNGSLNQISLGTTSNKAHLGTTDIVAGNQGKNQITLYGNLTFLTLTEAKNSRVPELIAKDGGENDIKVYEGTINTGNVDKEGSISGSGSNVNMIAKNGGKNYLMFTSTETGSSTLNTIEASNGGHNTLLNRDNRHSVTIENLFTHNGGKNLVGLAISATTNNSSVAANYEQGSITDIYLGSFKGSLTAKNFENESESNFTSGVHFSLVGSDFTEEYKSKYQKIVKSNSSNPNDPFAKIDATNNALTLTGLINGKLNLKGSSYNPTLTLEDNSAFVGEISKDNPSTPITSVTLKSGAKLVLNSQTSINTLTLTPSTTSETDFLQGTLGLTSTVIDLTTKGRSDLSTVKDNISPKTLTVTTLTISGSGSGNPLLRFGAKLDSSGKGEADKISVTTITNEGAKANVQVFLTPDALQHDFSKDPQKTYIFEVTNGSNGIDLTPKKSVSGFVTYDVEISPEDDQKKKWFLGKTTNQQISEDALSYSSSVMGLNYGIFTQNINSLNKRMGELRDNPYNSGVWARIYGGEMRNTMEYIPVDIQYVNLQGGYDHAFRPENATNYLGVALTYGYATSYSNDIQGEFNILGYTGKSNTLELALYNSYVQDEGLFSDTIAKLSYFSSDFDIKNILGKPNLNNFAFSLGEEIGYRFRLGEQKQFFIDPQAEFVLGYFNKTVFNHEQFGQILRGDLDGILAFRTRVGSDLGYTLKQEDNSYDFRVGLSYEYDAAGANSHFKINELKLDKTLKDTVVSDSRVVLNLGTNMSFGENVKAYFDFESSFAGKITTTYQLNAGIRYSFGEKIMPKEEAQEEKQAALPLKID